MTDTVQQTLTPAEIAKVFALYQPCECIQEGWFPNAARYREMICVDNGSEQCRVVLNKNTGENFWFDLKSCKLLLTSLKHITDEDAVQVADILRYRSEEYFQKEVGHSRIEAIRKLLSAEGFHYYGGQPLKMIDAYQYLISRGYAVPIWLGVNHWANGKDAITLGIAVEIRT